MTVRLYKFLIITGVWGGITLSPTIPSIHGMPSPRTGNNFRVNVISFATAPFFTPKVRQFHLCEAVQTKNQTPTDWVNPLYRNRYPGYALEKDRKETSKDWRFFTNRPRGNIRGGGTTDYYDYQPQYPAAKRFKGQKKRDPALYPYSQNQSP